MIKFSQIEEVLSKLIAFPTANLNSGLECLNYIKSFLADLDFKSEDISSEGVGNIYCKYIVKDVVVDVKNFCFAGHVDVVPPGPSEQWRSDPFKLNLERNIAYGRGMVDMKGAIACFLIALKLFLKNHQPAINLSVMVTSDEEGPAINGTAKILEHLANKKEKIDYCLIGEPTSEKAVGDTIKIGRRGSATFKLTIHGIQGHVAYPLKSVNAIPLLMAVLQQLIELKIDDGDGFFQPSHLEIVRIFSDELAYNVIPGGASAIINVRHIPSMDLEKLYIVVENICKATIPLQASYQIERIGESRAFMTNNLDLANTIQDVTKRMNIKSVLSTSGGTSDGRFINNYCSNLAELGLSNSTAHKVNEHCHIKDLETLALIYYNLLVEINGS